MDRMPPINPGYGKDLNGLSDAEANGNSEESSSVKPVNIENEIPKVEADFFSEMDKKGVKRPVETVDPSLSVSDKKTRLDGGLSETGDLVLNESQEIQDLASLKHDLKSREELLDLYAELKSSQNDRKCRKVKRKILGKQGEFYLESILGCILVKQFEKRNISIKDVNEKTFKREVLLLLKDLNSRGITINQKLKELDMRPVGDFTRGDNMSDNLMSRLNNYFKYYDEIHHFDASLEKHLLSDDCEKWKADSPLYRGGDATFERKTIRNLKKGKPAFKKEYINRGGVVFGYG